MARPRSDARERILDAAVTLLRTEGVGAFSTPRVAALANVPQGHLTYYFPRRADLLLEVATIFSSDVVTEATQLMQAPTRDDGAAFELIGRLARDRQRTRILVGLLVEADSDDALAAALEQNTKMVLAGLASLVTHAGDDVSDGDDVDTELLLCALWGIGLRHMQRTGPAGERRTSDLLDAVKRKLAAPRETERANATKQAPAARRKR